MVKAREKFNPEISKDYWLGYVGRYNSGFSWHGAQSVNGVYFGVWNGRHLFLNLNSEGEIEKYSCPAGKCYLAWWGEEDHPSISSPDVNFEGVADEIKERPATMEMVKSAIRQIREDEKRAGKEKLEEMFAKSSLVH